MALDKATNAEGMLPVPGGPSNDELAAQELLRGVNLYTTGPLLRDCPVRRLEPGDVLIATGRPNANLYLLLSGELSVRLASAQTTPIARIEAGESVGELSMIDGQPTSAFVVADAPSRVLEVDEQLLWLLVNTSHAVSTNLLFVLAKRLRFGNRVIFEDRERLEQYRFHATVDALTGLFNRHWLGTMLPRQMHRSRLCNQPFCLLMIDIDRFKPFNDQHGHVAGDRAIGAVAQTLQNSLRPTDMAARYGGEEFLVLLPNCAIDAARDVADRLRAAVAATPVAFSHGDPLPSVTISLGIAQMSGECTVESFIGAADAAMYRAKRAGRNRAAV